MNTNTKITKILIAAAVAFLFCSSAQAGLLSPTSRIIVTSSPQLNGNPPLNTAYTPSTLGNSLTTPTDLLGGDIQNTTGATWYVTGFTVWAVGGTSDTLPGFAPPTLFGGDASGTIAGIAGAPASETYTPYTVSADSNPNYLSSSTGNHYAVWQLNYNVSLTITPGEDYVFGVSGSDGNPLTATAGVPCTAVTCVSSGIVEYTAGGAVVGAWNYLNTSAPNAVNSDVNVALYGTTSTPEPATWLLLGAGVGVLGLVRRRRG
jgi:hypothetical protein